MEIIITDRHSIETGIIIRWSYVVISIHDPDKRPAKVRRQAGLHAVLHLAFHDAEPSARMTLPPAIKLITPAQATRIHQFVETHRNNVGAIVIHCEQGMSRSPAVAAAISKPLGVDDRRFWREYQPNQYVYAMVLQATAGSTP